MKLLKIIDFYIEMGGLYEVKYNSINLLEGGGTICLGKRWKEDGCSCSPKYF